MRVEKVHESGQIELPTLAPLILRSRSLRTEKKLVTLFDRLYYDDVHVNTEALDAALDVSRPRLLPDSCWRRLFSVYKSENLAKNAAWSV